MGSVLLSSQSQPWKLTLCYVQSQPQLVIDEIRAGLDLLVSGSIIKKCFTSKTKAKRLSCQSIMDM